MIRRIRSYLGTHLAIFILWLLSYLPYPFVARLGESLGSLAFLFPSKRKRVVLTNLQVCFPEWTPTQRLNSARQTFRYVVRSFAERGMLWFGSAQRICKWVHVDDQAGLEKFTALPSIILGMHLVGIEAGALRLTLYLNEIGVKNGLTTLYTPMKNRRFDAFVKRARERFSGRMLLRSDRALTLLRLIRQGTAVQLSPDMDFGHNDSEFVDFFNVPACTLTVVSRLARLTGAKIIPVVTDLLPAYQGYVLRILPAWENYPGEDIHTDTRRMNAFFESRIVADPAQYYWVHRRFKTRPADMPPLY